MDNICLDCFNYKTRCFYSIKDLEHWCEDNGINMKMVWPKRILAKGKIRLYWCSITMKVKVLYRENKYEPFIREKCFFKSKEVRDVIFEMTRSVNDCFKIYRLCDISNDFVLDSWVDRPEFEIRQDLAKIDSRLGILMDGLAQGQDVSQMLFLRV